MSVERDQEGSFGGGLLKDRLSELNENQRDHVLSRSASIVSENDRNAERKAAPVHTTRMAADAKNAEVAPAQVATCAMSTVGGVNSGDCFKIARTADCRDFIYFL